TRDWRSVMPTFETSPGVNLHYQVDDFTDPWTEPETILLLHGNAESGLAWYAWVPRLARRFRTVRPDMRGYGASTPMPRDFKWSLDVIIDDSDIRADVPKIACPTLVITTDESGLASVEETRAWQRQIPGSELLVIDGNSYHVAASHAERCADAVLDFIARKTRDNRPGR